MSARPDGTLEDLEQTIADLRRERDEGLAREAALAEVLQVINSSPDDLAAVFDAVLEKATRLCEADGGYFLRYQDGNHTFAAGHGLQPELAAFLSQHSQPPAGSPAALVVQGAPYIHITDLKNDDYQTGEPRRRAIVDLGGFRTGLIVPMRRGDVVLGSFNLGRSEVRPFTDKQIALVQNFAAQAVIAMENARLLSETREALEQQTATAEVLQVINSSPGDLAPVFEAMLEKAINLCQATFGALWTYDGKLLHVTAVQGAPLEYENFLKRGAHQPTALQRRLLDGGLVEHIADVTLTEGYKAAQPLSRAGADLGGIRTLLAVALHKDGRCSVSSAFTARRCDLSRTSRSHCCRISPRRR